MTEAVIPVRHLRDITTCPICLDAYTDPRLLPCCAHTFCLHCISDWVTGERPGDEASCPMCRRTFTIPTTGIGELPRNIFIEQLIAVELSSAVSARLIYCNWCEKDDVTNKPATVRCVECKENLCEACRHAHSKHKSSRNHRLHGFGENAEDAYPNLASPKCDQHPDKDREMYCRDCDEVLCMLCFLTKHKSHRADDVKKAADGFRRKLNEHVSTLKAGISQISESQGKQQESRRKTVKQFGDVEGKINASADQLIAVIERHRKQLLSECKLLADHCLENIDRRIDEVDREKKMAECAMKLCEQLRNNGSDNDVIRELKTIGWIVDELERSNRIRSQPVPANVIAFEPAAVIGDSVNCIGKVVTAFDRTVRFVRDITSPGGAAGFAEVDNRLFVPCNNSNSINVFSSNYNPLKTIQVSGMKQPRDIVYCADTNSLYVADLKAECIWVVSTDGCRQDRMITKGGAPMKLSVKSTRLLVTPLNQKQLLLYDKCRTLKLEISLPRYMRAEHAIELKKGVFLVCHTTWWHSGSKECEQISEINEKGIVLRAFGGQRGDGPRCLFWPRHMAVHPIDGTIFVADSQNKRVLMVDRHLKDGRVALCKNDEPRRLYLSPNSLHLLVGYSNSDVIGIYEME